MVCVRAIVAGDFFVGSFLRRKVPLVQMNATEAFAIIKMHAAEAFAIIKNEVASSDKLFLIPQLVYLYFKLALATSHTQGPRPYNDC
jgi:hypothetical protein